MKAIQFEKDGKIVLCLGGKVHVTREKENYASFPSRVDPCDGSCKDVEVEFDLRYLVEYFRSERYVRLRDGSGWTPRPTALPSLGEVETLLGVGLNADHTYPSWLESARKEEDEENRSIARSMGWWDPDRDG